MVLSLETVTEPTTVVPEASSGTVIGRSKHWAAAAVPLSRPSSVRVASFLMASILPDRKVN